MGLNALSLGATYHLLCVNLPPCVLLPAPHNASTDMAGTQCRHKYGRHNQHVVPLSFMPQVSNISMPLYALLPACTEWLAENGYTLTYPRIENVGLPMYAIFFLLYMASVEFGVYWMHRGLHEVKIGYRCVNCMR